jgi:glycosyltransferase involved in cell wall biosynthesis
VGSDRGLIPEMLSNGRGVIVPTRDSVKLANALEQIAIDPQRFESMRSLAAKWASLYSIEGLRDAITNLLQTHWKLYPNDRAVEYETVRQEVN